MSYEKPKIITIDTPASVSECLIDQGFNVHEGSFGEPYKVEMSSGFSRVRGNPHLPNLAEQEIIIVDLDTDVREQASGEYDVPSQETDWWCKKSQGYVDPRPKYIHLVSSTIRRIMNHGGILIIYGASIPSLTYTLAHTSDRGSYFEDKQLTKNLWNVLPIVSRYLSARNSEGVEINTNDNDILGSILGKHVNSLSYELLFSPTRRINRTDNALWVPAAENKYGDFVSGSLVNTSNDSITILLPQSTNKGDITVDVLTNMLPELKPHLFPDFKLSSWTTKNIYEINEVSKLKDKKRELKESFNRKVQVIDEEIEKIREDRKYLFEMLSKSGDGLVKSVLECLKKLGFKNVVDVDKKREYNKKQEDIQIMDKKTKLIVEVKGSTSLPNEEDITQVVKYIPRRMNEWDEKNIQGVVIVNHQKNIPPLKRDNEKAFSSQQILDAKNHNVMLITTWDLHRLVRGVINWDWPKETVRKLFYTSGRPNPIPSHYSPVGKIFNYFAEASAYGLDVESESISIGDTLGYVFNYRFFEEQISSIEIDNKPIKTAKTGQKVGIGTDLSGDEIKNVNLVYKVDK